MHDEHKWDVFVSHNWRDKPWVRDTVQELRGSGLKVFFDEDSIDPGDDVVSAIEKAVADSRFVVLVLSRSSIDSKWVALEAGITLFHDTDSMQSRLIPVQLEPIDSSLLRPAIRRLNCVDLSDSSRYQGEYGRLLNVLGIGKANINRDHSNTIEDQKTMALPLNVPMPVLSVMGTKGGSGKTTVVVAMAELIASTGHNVLIVDADLESAGVTNYLGGNARAKPQVWTLKDASFDKQSTTTQKRRRDLGAWDVTPSYLREGDLGHIYLIPAGHEGDSRPAYEALANIQPNSRRNRATVEIIRDTVQRHSGIANDIRAVLIDSGAEGNPLVSAGITAADEAYIVSGPHAKFARAVPDAERTHRERYPDYSHRNMHVVVNQATDDAKKSWSHHADIHFVMEDPDFRAIAAEGKVDFEGVGLNNLYLQVLRLLQETLPSVHHSILPDPTDVWIQPYLKKMRDFPDRLASSPAYRYLSLFTASTVGICALMLLLSAWVIGNALWGPWRPVSVEALPHISNTVAELIDHMSHIAIPEEYRDRVYISGQSVQVNAPLSSGEQAFVEKAIAYEPAVKARRMVSIKISDAQSPKFFAWLLVAIFVLALAGCRIARHIALSKRRHMLRKLIALRVSGNERELKKWVTEILWKGQKNSALMWLRQQYRRRVGNIDPLE